MKGKFVLIIVMVLLADLMVLSLVSCKKQNYQKKAVGTEPGLTAPATLPRETITLSGEEFTVELAFTRRDRLRGLMYRRELAEHAGMLFVFEKSLPRSFHMQNCLIDLDILFIEADGAIARITTMQVPPPDEPSKNYYCSIPCKYALELPAGAAQKLKLAPGMKIDFPPRVKTIIPDPE